MCWIRLPLANREYSEIITPQILPHKYYPLYSTSTINNYSFVLVDDSGSEDVSNIVKKKKLKMKEKSADRKLKRAMKMEEKVIKQEIQGQGYGDEGSSTMGEGFIKTEDDRVPEFPLPE